MNSRRALIAATLLVALVAGRLPAQVTLYGITGNQEDDDQASFPDYGLFTIDVNDASTSMVTTLTGIPDTHVIGANPSEPNLIYHFGGSEAWTDDPGREGGFRDHQYLETYDLLTGEITPIFNANPDPSPDDFPSFGLPAPRPSFILPEEQRLVDDPAPREDGENEYHALRGITWSDTENVWYASDEKGFYTVTTDGTPTWIGQPVVDDGAGMTSDEVGDMKGIAFYTSETGTVLLAGSKRTANLWTIDAGSGEQIDEPVELNVPAGSDFDVAFEGLLGMAQHPDTGVLYGIRRISEDPTGPFDRELITIDPTTGDTTLVGTLGLHFTSMVFVSSGLAGDFNGNGELDAGDMDELTANLGGEAKFDLNGDGVVDLADRDTWVTDIRRTYSGDSNLDGEFNTTDMVQAFAAGEYEDAEVGNSTWAEGDWDGDGDFTSGDLVKAFGDGGYEQGPRAATQSVPEPAGLGALAIGFAMLLWTRRTNR